MTSRRPRKGKKHRSSSSGWLQVVLTILLMLVQVSAILHYWLGVVPGGPTMK
jgi:hypothetical protein